MFEQKLHRLTLRFSKEIEPQFLEDYFIAFGKPARTAFIVALVLNLFWGIVDYTYFKITGSMEIVKNILLLRYFMVLPVIVLTMLLSFTKYYKNHMQTIISFGITLSAIGFILMSAQLPYPYDSTYYNTIYLIYIYSYGFSRLRFIYAAAVSWIVLFTYVVIASSFSKTSFALMSPNIIAANILAMFGSYYIEINIRKNFIQGKIIKDQAEELLKNNKQLAIRNEQLVQSQKELVELHQRADRIFSAFADALPGTILDNKYQLENKIGAGGFGAVFSAIHISMKRPVAVKIFKPRPGNDSAENLERFQQEAISASRINHPNAVAILDSGISNEGIAYLVMELLNGHSLAKELSEKKYLSIQRCAEILNPICDVLSKAHEVGIIHRDIKPENIFIHQSKDGEQIKVVDFGIAKFMFDSGSIDVKNLTATGGLIGTPSYIAPERFEDKPYDGLSDVYSMGVMLYELLCGRVPFLPGTGGVLAVMMQHLTQPPPLLRQIRPDIPIEIEKIVLSALEKDPAKRLSIKKLTEDFSAVASRLS